MDDNKTEFLAHSGVKGMKHGVRRYQNEDGSLTPEGRRHYGLNPKYANVSNADMQKELAYARNKSEYVGLMTANARKKSDDVKALTKSIVGLAKTGTSAASTVANQRKTDAESRINAANADINKQISDLKTTQAAQQKMIKGMMNDSSKTDERSKLEKEYLSNDEKLKSYNKQIEANNAEKGQYQDAVDRANYNKNMTDNAAKVADQTGAYDYAGKFASRKEYESERQQAMDNLEELDPDQLKSIIDRIKLEKEYENLLNPPKPSKMEQFKKAFDSIDHWLALGLTIMQIRSLMQKRNTANASQDAFSDEEFLEHYGVKGQKWGVLRYTNEDGTLNAAGMKRYGYTEGDAKSATKAVNRMEKDFAKAALVEQVNEIRNQRIVDKYGKKEEKAISKGNEFKAREIANNSKYSRAQNEVKESRNLIDTNESAKNAAVNNVLKDKNLFFKNKETVKTKDATSGSQAALNALSMTLAGIGSVGMALASPIGIGVVPAPQRRELAVRMVDTWKALDVNKDAEKIDKYCKKASIHIDKALAKAEAKARPKAVMAELRKRAKLEEQRKKLQHSEFLAHAGVKGMKKGVRRYQNADGSLTPEGYRHYGIDPNWQPQKQETPDEREKRIRKQIESDYRTKALKAKYETKAERTRSKEVERQMFRENKMEIQRMKQLQTAQNKINQQNLRAEAKIENQAKADNRKNVRKNVMKAVVGSAVVGMLVAKGVHKMNMERLMTMNAHEARMAKINGGGFINHVLNNRNSKKLAKINGRTQIETAKAVGENGSVSFGTAAATKNAAKATSMTISGGNSNAKTASEKAKPVSEPKPKNATSEKPKSVNESKPKNVATETKPVIETPNKTGVPGKEIGVKRVEPKRTFTEQREHDKRQKELEKTFYGSVVDQTGNFTANNKTMLNDEDRKRLAELKEAQRRRNEEKGLIEKKTVENGESMISDIFKRLGGKK